jgi:hypothetical protein
MRKRLNAISAGIAAAFLSSPGFASIPVVRTTEDSTTREQLAAAALPPAANLAPAGEPSLGEARRLYVVKGFRSALFGMTEAEVKAAIVRDFAALPETIATSASAAEGTTVLMVRTRLPPGPGDALIGYVLGASRHRLFRVNVIWSTGTAPTKAERLEIANAAVQIAAYFRKQAWPATAPIKTGLTPDGVLVFEAADQEGSSIAVEAKGVLVTRKIAGKVQQSQPVGASYLRISFAQDASHPDVATIGQASRPSP